jgi:hypothetical protein
MEHRLAKPFMLLSHETSSAQRYVCLQKDVAHISQGET